MGRKNNMKIDIREYFGGKDYHYQKQKDNFEFKLIGLILLIGWGIWLLDNANIKDKIFHQTTYCFEEKIDGSLDYYKCEN